MKLMKVMWWRCENIVIALETFYMHILYHHRSKINKHTVCGCNLHIWNGAVGPWLTLELVLWWEMNSNKRHQLYETYVYHGPLRSGCDYEHNYSWQDFSVWYDWCPTDYPLSERLHRNRLLRASKRLIENWGKPPQQCSSDNKSSPKENRYLPCPYYSWPADTLG